MAVDGPLDPDGDDPERDGDIKPDRSPDHGRAGGDGTGVLTRLAETRDRGTYYDALRAADSRSAISGDGPEPTALTEEPRSGWEAPELVDHPDRPPPESFHVPSERATHILDGDATGGGHRHGTGRPGKTEFPATWDDDKIIENIADVAHGPDNVHQQWNERWKLRGTRDGVEITVIIDPDGAVWTAWPEEGSPGVVRNPKKGNP